MLPGFTSESYGYGPRWSNPQWALDRAVYTVTVRLVASGVTKTARFKLDNLAADFARFRTSHA